METVLEGWPILIITDAQKNPHYLLRSFEGVLLCSFLYNTSAVSQKICTIELCQTMSFCRYVCENLEIKIDTKSIFLQVCFKILYFPQGKNLKEGYPMTF